MNFDKVMRVITIISIVVSVVDVVIYAIRGNAGAVTGFACATAWAVVYLISRRGDANYEEDNA